MDFRTIHKPKRFLELFPIQCHDGVNYVIVFCPINNNSSVQLAFNTQSNKHHSGYMRNSTKRTSIELCVFVQYTNKC